MSSITREGPDLASRLESAADGLLAALTDLTAATSAASRAVGRNRPLTSAEQLALDVAMRQASFAMGAYQTLATLGGRDLAADVAGALLSLVDEDDPAPTAPVGSTVETVTVDEVPVDGTAMMRMAQNWAGSPWGVWTHVVGEQPELEYEGRENFRTLDREPGGAIRLRRSDCVQVRRRTVEDGLSEADGWPRP